MSSIRKIVHWTTFFTVLIFALTLLLAIIDVSLNSSSNAKERRWCEQHTSCQTWECCLEFIVFLRCFENGFVRFFDIYR